MDKVQTNNLTNVHLGSYNDSFFGKINSSFISQLDTSSFQFFGDLTQDQENNGGQLNFINENEQLTAVYLDLPFFNNTNDKDNDGVTDQEGGVDIYETVKKKQVTIIIKQDKIEEKFRRLFLAGT